MVQSTPTTWWSNNHPLDVLLLFENEISSTGMLYEHLQLIMTVKLVLEFKCERKNLKVATVLYQRGL